MTLIRSITSKPSMIDVQSINEPATVAVVPLSELTVAVMKENDEYTAVVSNPHPFLAAYGGVSVSEVKGNCTVTLTLTADTEDAVYVWKTTLRNGEPPPNVAVTLIVNEETVIASNLTINTTMGRF